MCNAFDKLSHAEQQALTRRQAEQLSVGEPFASDTQSVAFFRFCFPIVGCFSIVGSGVFFLFAGFLGKGFPLKLGTQYPFFPELRAWV